MVAARKVEAMVAKRDLIFMGGNLPASSWQINDLLQPN
jgi:hypothetical protein